MLLPNSLTDSVGQASYRARVEIESETSNEAWQTFVEAKQWATVEVGTENRHDKHAVARREGEIRELPHLFFRWRRFVESHE